MTRLLTTLVILPAACDRINVFFYCDFCVEAYRRRWETFSRCYISQVSKSCQIVKKISACLSLPASRTWTQSVLKTRLVPWTRPLRKTGLPRSASGARAANLLKAIFCETGASSVRVFLVLLRRWKFSTLDRGRDASIVRQASQEDAFCI